MHDENLYVIFKDISDSRIFVSLSHGNIFYTLDPVRAEKYRADKIGKRLKKMNHNHPVIPFKMISLEDAVKDKEVEDEQND